MDSRVHFLSQQITLIIIRENNKSLNSLFEHNVFSPLYREFRMMFKLFIRSEILL